MNGEVRRKLDMADRVRVFNRTHPSGDAGLPPLSEQLDERVVRAEAVAAMQRSGRLAEGAGTARRRELRAKLQQGLLRLLVRAGEAAAKEVPELAKRFQLPSLGATSRTFLTAARTMLTEARQRPELFVRFGMSAPLLDELGGLLDQYGTSVEEAFTGRQQHVAARAELQEIASEIMDLVERIGSYYRHRFRDDPDELAAWESASNLIGPFRGQAVTPAPPPPPADGGIAAAA